MSLRRYTKPITELTEKHLAIYKGFVEKWLNILGVNNYVVSFALEHKKDCIAVLHSDSDSRTAHFKLSDVWERIVPNDEELERAAIHECAHLLLSQYEQGMDEIHHKTSEEEDCDKYHELYYSFVHKEAESIAVTLENVLFKLSRKR